MPFHDSPTVILSEKSVNFGSGFASAAAPLCAANSGVEHQSTDRRNPLAGDSNGRASPPPRYSSELSFHNRCGDVYGLGF